MGPRRQRLREKVRAPVGLLACGPRRLNGRAGRCMGDGPEAGLCRADWVGGVRQAKGGSRPGLRWLGGFWAERDGRAGAG